MVSVLRVLILVICLAALAAPVCAQEIANWPAPATWTPEARPASEDSGRALSAAVATIMATYPALPFIGLTPCRLADTRGNGFTGQYGPPSLAGNSKRDFTIGGTCGIPPGLSTGGVSAAAVSFNFTVTNNPTFGDIRVFPAGGSVLVSTLNWGPTTGNVANAAVVPLSESGAITVQVDGPGPLDLVIDVNGYYGSPAVDFSNVFLGPGAGNTTMTGTLNTGIGALALGTNTAGSNNTATGSGALHSNTTGSGNTATGIGTLGANTTGFGNTASGSFALQDNTTGNSNTASGSIALVFNTTGNDNTASGSRALQNNSTGSGNIAIGSLAGSNLSTEDNNIDIANFGVAGDSATIRIGTGGTHTRAFLAGVRGISTGANDAVAVMIDSAGQLGTVSSSRRVKQDIEDMGEASQGLMRLRPVTFRYDASLDPAGSRQYGLIAEEVAEAFPDLVVFDKEGKPETVRYHVLVPMLLNEVQNDRRTIANLASRLERLEALISESSR